MPKNRSAIIPLLMTVTLTAAFAGTAVAKDNLPPPREIPLVEVKQEQLSLQEVDTLGKKAFSVEPKKWKHAESENFVIHYRRATEARRVIREVEYTLWYVANALGRTRQDYTQKSHIFIFSGTGDWKTFLSDTDVSPWAGSFAYGSDLYLNIGSATEPFDSQMLAHEVSHAVVARLYPGKRWPLWLNEGLAEYMGTASIASRRQQTLKSLQGDLTDARMPLDELVQLTAYPKDRSKVSQLYKSSERLVRFIMTRYPKEKLSQFVDAVLNGRDLEGAVLEVYGDQVADYKTFKREYSAFER